MMNRNLTIVVGQRRRHSVIRAGMCVLASVLMLALAAQVQAQTFDQAISTALGTGVSAPGPACKTPIPGSKLNSLCEESPTLSGAASSGSITALSDERFRADETLRADERRKAERVIGPVNVFISGDYERFDKNVTTFEAGHKTNTARVALGADYAFSNRFLVGGAFKYGTDDGRFDAGGDFKTDSYGLQMYGNFVPAANAFVNGTAGYTRASSSINRLASIARGGPTSTLGAVGGDTNSNAFNVGVNGGYDFSFQSVTVGPRVGLRYKRTETGSYREVGSTGLELAYDAQTEKSLTSVLGAQGSVAIITRFGVVVPQATVEYVHEFQDSQRFISFRFVDNLTAGPFSFQNDPPDRNYFNLGLGVAVVWPRGISGFANYRGLAGYKDQSRHTFTIGLRIEL